MKNIFYAAVIVSLLSGCATNKKGGDDNLNPFLSEYNTPFNVPPFDKIQISHYKPAVEKAMAEHKNEIEAIINNSESPNFENTIAAFDRSGSSLVNILSVAYLQFDVDANEAMDKLSQELSPMVSKHNDDIALNPKLFARIKDVYNKRDSLNLDKEQMKLLDNCYKSFVRGGANLDEKSQQRLRELNSEISLLEVTFGQNALKETNAFKLVIDKKEDLAGLPQSLINSAAQTAKEFGEDGKWVFTLQNPSVMPFLQYADNRELREKIFKGYINRGNNKNENDNGEIVNKLIAARLEKAKLMGYSDYAAFVLEDRMAKNEKNVYDLLDQIWKPAIDKANEELADINAEIKKDGGNFTAQGWDWRYYTDRAKRAKFNLDENEIRPYLQLENVRSGLFYVANKLYGITMNPIKDIPLPHPDCEAYECKDSDGTHLGVVYFDYFTRASKRGGAWCGTYREQKYVDGKKVAPVVTIVLNFNKPTADEPSLLSVDDALTLFHEFGHGIHSLFKDVHYSGVGEVPRDFVELPSQIMEHWTFEPEVLAVYAKHYKSGETMPKELVEKMDKSGKYGQGFATTEYLAASLLDMDYHVIKTTPEKMDVIAFENQTLGKRGLLSQIPSRYRSTYFNHTMGGGYTAGYYSYIWAEVLDADAFQAFKETGNLFNQDVAQKFRKYVLTPGAIDDAMDMYVNFRGKSPNTEPLLKNRGLK